MPFIVTASAILIGIAVTWPLLFLYERVLKTMAYLEDLEHNSEGVSALSLLIARYAFGISWMVFAFVVFGTSDVFFSS